MYCVIRDVTVWNVYITCRKNEQLQVQIAPKLWWRKKREGEGTRDNEKVIERDWLQNKQKI